MAAGAQLLLNNGFGSFRLRGLFRSFLLLSLLFLNDLLQRLLDAAEGFPGRCAWCGRELADGDVFKLHGDVSTFMNLWGDDAFQRDIGVFLCVVGCFDPVDPDLDAGPLGEDAVLVPAKGIDALEEGLFIDRCRVDEATAVLIVDLSEPSLAAIDLVTGDDAIWKAGTADLDAAIDLTGLQISGALDH